MSEAVNKEDWMARRWRPAMGWLYMAVCACDFMLFPVLWSIHQALNHGQISSQWQPLTLQGAGLFHLAMGAVLGIAAYGRTQEKIAGAEQGGLGSFGQGTGTTYMPPNSQGMVNVNNTNSAPTSFGTNNTFASSNTNTAFASPGAFGATAPSWGATPANNFGGPAVTASGKKIVPQDQDPVL